MSKKISISKPLTNSELKQIVKYAKKDKSFERKIENMPIEVINGKIKSENEFNSKARNLIQQAKEKAENPEFFTSTKIRKMLKADKKLRETLTENSKKLVAEKITLEKFFELNEKAVSWN